MKILLIGDASNLHPALASGLRKLGQDVTIASEGCGFMQTSRQIDLRRRLPWKFGGLDLWMRLNGSLRKQLSGYDIVSVIGSDFVKLRPNRLRQIFNNLKADNGKVFLTALGTDWPFIEECLDPDSPLKYSEFRIHGQPGPEVTAHPGIIDSYRVGALRDWTEEFYSRIDGAVSVLYEYHLSIARRLPPSKIAYGGIPLEVEKYTPVEIPRNPEKVRFFLGRHAHRMAIKGTDLFETALRRALDRYPGRGEVVIVENRPYAEYVNLMRSAHVVVDQAYSYTPATNALISMAYGIPTVSGAEPAYYRFLTEQFPHLAPPTAPGPIFNSPVDVAGMTELFCDILRHPEQLHTRALEARSFVECYHDSRLVASRFLDFWTKGSAVKNQPHQM